MTNHLASLLALSCLLILSATQGSQCTLNTFSVTGNGQVSLSPDLVKFTIVATGSGPNAATALSRVNIQVNAVLKSFSAFNIPAANYSTSAINVNQLYNYSSDPVTITGSEATQNIQLTLSGPRDLTPLLQSFTNINVSVQNLVFDVFDKTSALQKARAAAFTDAKNKFQQYLTLTALQNDGIKKISDLNSEVYTPYQTDLNNYSLFTKLRGNPNPVQVSASVSVTWKVRA